MTYNGLNYSGKIIEKIREFSLLNYINILNCYFYNIITTDGVGCVSYITSIFFSKLLIINSIFFKCQCSNLESRGGIYFIQCDTLLIDKCCFIEAYAGYGSFGYSFTNKYFFNLSTILNSPKYYFDSCYSLIIIKNSTLYFNLGNISKNLFSSLWYLGPHSSLIETSFTKSTNILFSNFDSNENSIIIKVYQNINFDVINSNYLNIINNSVSMWIFSLYPKFYFSNIIIFYLLHCYLLLQ